MGVHLTRDEDTIAAIATPLGTGGIGVVRVSGSKAESIFRQIFYPNRQIEKLESHRLYYGWVKESPDSPPVDEVLSVVMKAPHSYTCEDVLEIQCHSGPAVLKRILEMALSRGARLAEPGEFTKRAFLNGRIDLTQAEAIVELTNAQSEYQQRLAAAQLSGKLGELINKVRQSMLNVLAQLEVAIDYPDEDMEILNYQDLKQEIHERILTPINRLITAYSQGHLLREGARIVLAGRPNVGKSSLFNALLGTSRVIVSSIPGTTRDVIEESMDLNGLKLTLVDTAGIHQATNDPIEDQGIQLASSQLDKADLILFVLDTSSPLTEEDYAIAQNIRGHKNVLAVLNKVDIAPPAAQSVQKLQKELDDILDKSEVLLVSATTGKGIEELKSRISACLTGSANMETNNLPAFVPGLRHKEALETAHSAIASSLARIEENAPTEIVAFDIGEALGIMDSIIGKNADEDLLDTIFSNFCLGK